MTASEVKEAFDQGCPVWYCKPNEKPILYEKIKEIVYSKHPVTGKIMVSCVLQDMRAHNSTTRVRSKYLAKYKQEVSTAD